MRIFGIDPGSTVTGFGVIEKRRGRVHFVHAGCIKTTSKDPIGERLQAIHAGLVQAIETHAPDEIAIESIFRYKSSESALRLGQARGVALLAAAQAGFETHEYNPMTIKRTVGAHGKADKKAVAKMVEMLLGTKIEGPADMTDALAIAICHANHSRLLKGVRS